MVVNRPTIGTASVLAAGATRGATPARCSVRTEFAISRVEHSTVNEHRAAVSASPWSLIIAIGTHIVPVSESQIDNGETDIGANFENANRIVSADGHGLSG